MATPPAVRGTASTNVDGGTSWVIDKPSGTIQYDGIIVTLSIRGNSDVTPPSTDWTLIEKQTGLGSASDQYSYKKVAGASESTAYTFTTDSAEDGTISAISFSGIDTTNFVDTYASQANTGSSTDITAPSVSPSVSDTRLLMIAHAPRETTLTPPSSWTEELENTKTTSYQISESLNTYTHSSTSATGTVVAGQSDSGTSIGTLIAIAPSPYTLTQEGFRFRNDDGSEATATWLANQDTNVTQDAETTTRLRVLIDASGDPTSTQYKLQYRKVGDADSEWEDVE